MSSLVSETKLRQVQQLLLQKIQNGEYSQGMQLPGARQLAQQFGVSYLTANNVLRSLVKIGEHIHVLGMNNIPFASMPTPGLSSIDLNTQNIGEILTTAIQENWHGKTVKVAPKIVLRGSSK